MTTIGYKKKVFYPFIHVDRIGEIADQMFCLRNLYPVTSFDVNVITYDPLTVIPANKAFFNIATRGMKVIYTNDNSIVASCYVNPSVNKIIEKDNSIFVMLMHSQIKSRLLDNSEGTAKLDYFTLSNSDITEGEQLRSNFDIPENAKIVCVYVRDGAYFDNDVGSNYRNADIMNYIPTIQHLLDNGYYILRIGDKKMKPLKIANPKFIDTPFHPAYTEMVEPYFIAQCQFMIGTPSGPLGIALYFNKPVIYSNTTIDSVNTLMLNSNTILLFKKYYSTTLERSISYEEILLSPSVDFFRTRLFNDSRIVLIDNSAEELLAATKEMVARLNNTYPLNKEVDKIIDKIHLRADLFRQKFVHKETIPYLPFYSLHRYKATLSHEFIRMNPWFLGHNWPVVKSWGWEPELENSYQP